jgi:hypothetical protein
MTKCHLMIYFSENNEKVLVENIMSFTAVELHEMIATTEQS